MSFLLEEERERKMLERAGILPERPKFPRVEDPYTALLGLGYDLLLHTRASALEENPLLKRIESLEKKVQHLEKEKEVERTFSKADLIYFKFKNELEQEHFGRIVAIDVDSEEIVGIGNSILEAYSEAKRHSSKKQFSYRRVGFDFVHRM